MEETNKKEEQKVIIAHPVAAKTMKKKKKQRPLVTIIIIILIVLALIIGGISIYLFTEKEYDEPEETTTTTTAVTTTVPVEGSIVAEKGIFLVPNSIDYNSEYNDYKVIAIRLTITNQTNYTILPTFKNIKINDNEITQYYYSLDKTYSNEVAYGVSSNEELGATLYIVKNNLTENITSLTFNFGATNEESINKYNILNDISTSIDMSTLKVNNSSALSEKLFFNENNIKISYVRKDEYNISFFIENNTGKNITIKSYDVYIDDVYQSKYTDETKYGFWSISLAQDESKYSRLFNTSDYVYTPASIKTLRLKFEIIDTDSNEVLSNTKEYTLTFE